MSHVCIVGTREWKYQKVEEIISGAERMESNDFEEVYIGIMEPEKTTTRGSPEEINSTENPEEAQVRGTKVIVRMQIADDPVHKEKLQNEVIFPMRLWTLFCWTIGVFVGILDSVTP